MASRDDMLTRLPTGLNKETSSNNAKILAIPGTEVDGDQTRMDKVSLAASLETAEGGALDRYGRNVQVYREPAETDAEYKPRVIGGFLRLASGGTIREIVTFAAAALGLETNQVTPVENMDQATGKPRPRYYYLDASIDGLVAQGITTQAAIDAIFDKVEAVLSEVDAGGVIGELFVRGDFTYEGDGGDLGPTGQGTATNGYFNDSIADAGLNNDGGYWGAFS